MDAPGEHLAGPWARLQLYKAKPNHFPQWLCQFMPAAGVPGLDSLLLHVGAETGERAGWPACWACAGLSVWLYFHFHNG